MAFRFARVQIHRWSLGIAVAALAACATPSLTPEQAVSQRAAESWQARQAADFDKAYTFMPPSYRAVTPLERYKRSFGTAAQVTDSKVEKVACETQDKCVATVRLEAKVVALRGKAPPVVTYYDETWVREDGQWWVFPTQ